MSKDQAEAQIKAAAWAAVAALGANEALRLLKQVETEISNLQWSGPGNR